MKCLVTGPAGFLGQYLTEQLLAQGHEVRGLGRGEYPELAAQGVELVRGDLRDRRTVSEACRGADVVYHVAGLAGVWGRWADYHAINVLGTENVVAGCLEHCVTRLVYTSTPSVTFNGRDQRGIDESTPYSDRWLCHYPHSKALAEQHVLASNGAEHAGGRLWTCALRPHLIWGPRDHHLIPRLIARARSGRLRQVGDGQNLIDVAYVENAAAAHWQAAQRLTEGSTVCGRAYFISQGTPVNCWEWINEILALAKLPPVRKRISAAAAWRLGQALECLYGALRKSDEPPMTRFVAAQLSTSHYFDLTRARQDFDYQPAVSQEEGMRRLAESL